MRTLLAALVVMLGTVAGAEAAAPGAVPPGAIQMTGPAPVVPSQVTGLPFRADIQMRDALNRMFADSAKEEMVQCRTMAHAPHADVTITSDCAGTVEEVLDTAVRYLLVCLPPRAQSDHAQRIVMQYIDAHPARQEERFVILAYDALRAAWPCSASTSPTPRPTSP